MRVSGLGEGTAPYVVRGLGSSKGVAAYPLRSSHRPPTRAGAPPPATALPSRLPALIKPSAAPPHSAHHAPAGQGLDALVDEQQPRPST
eukprot:4001353-Prymnesium_polylepis.1